MRIEAYDSSQQKIWDDFAQGSKNGTFLFLRNYMDYHRDRFVDNSLLIRDDKGCLIALMPANKMGDTLISHGGLTYGGFITGYWMRMSIMLEVFEHTLAYLKQHSFTTLIYKTIPFIYHTIPAEEDTYCLFLRNAALYRRDVTSVIDYRERPSLQARRQRGIRKALNADLIVRETSEYRQFWDILTENLYARHRIRPVHSLDEITLLAGRFPDQIRLFAAYQRGVMRGGAVVYLSPNVCHVQYNAASEQGKALSALDLLINHLIEYYSESKKFFDLGVSTEGNGQYLNPGLVEYKESFGARTVVHDFYQLDLTNL
jgi:hypothetical protein